jgi:hypothetical protein
MSTDYGEPRFSFRDHRGPVWAMLVLGLALGAAGLIFMAIGLIEPPKKPDDLAVMGVMVGVFVTGGAFFAIWGLRDLLQPPQWHISASHAFRTRGDKVIKVVDLAQQAEVQLIEMIRFGKVFGVQVKLGDSMIVAPSTDVARAIVEVWEATRQ